MIFYGTKASNIKNGQIINVDCPHCETNTSMIYSVFGKYAHVYWIPFFPIGRVTVAECANCKRTYEYSELTPQIQTKLQREKEKEGAKTPIWMFSGLGIVAVLICIGIYSSGQTEKEEAEYLKNPKAGDVYEMKIENGHFSTARVDKVDKDSVYVTLNDYETDKSSGISEIDVAKNYTIFKVSLSKKMVQNLYEKDSIFAINRE